MAEELTRRQIAQRERRAREAREASQALEQQLTPEQEAGVAPQELGHETPIPVEQPEQALGAPSDDDSLEPSGSTPQQEMLSEEAPTGPSVDSRTPSSFLPATTEDDDMSGLLYENFQMREMQRISEELDAAAPATGSPIGGEEPPPTPEDPHGIRLAPVPFVGGNLLLSNQAMNKQVLGGARDAVQNTFGAMDSFAEWANENILDLRAYETQLFDQLPEVEEPQTVPQGLVRGLSQFLTGWIPFLKGVKMAQGGTRVGNLGTFVQAEVSAGIAASIVFDPMEDNLSNLIEEAEVAGYSLSNPITRFLAKDEDDSESLARMKDAIEGMAAAVGLTAVGEGVVRGVNALKKARQERMMQAPDIDDPAIQQRMWEGLGDPEGPSFTRAAPADADSSTARAVDKETVQKWMDGDIPADKLPFKINWARITGPEDAQKLVSDISHLFRGQIDQARRGTITDENLRKLAEDLNMKPEDLLARNQGQAFNAEHVLASRMIIESSANHLIELGRRYQHSMNDAEMYQLMRMMNLHVGLQAQFQGAAAEAGRALRAYRIPTGSPEQQIRDIQETLMAGGGPC